MKTPLKHALSQGIFVFIGSLASTNLLLPLLIENNRMPSSLGIFLFTLGLGVIRGVRIYFYKKNVVEDERLIAVRQRAQAIWFNVTINFIAFIPFLAMLYAGYIQNPSLSINGQFVTLENLAYFSIGIVCFLLLLVLIGSIVTQKILMKAHEK